MSKARKHIFSLTVTIKSRIPFFTAFLILSIITGLAFISTGCSASKAEGFAIYLTKEDIPPEQMDALSNAEPADQAFIRTSDIVSYNELTHELKLNQDAYDRIFKLEVPVRGKTFLVCVDKKTVYWGAFWTPLSSQSFDGVTICKPLNSSEPYIVTLEPGYPSSSFYTGEDPRNSTEILEVLKKSGKLISELTISDVKVLPKSLKGYELYSWQEDDGWHYTLITGTNRNKTIEEITSGEYSISETGCVNIHCIGEDAIKAVLEKIPPGEYISWNNGGFESDGVVLAFPPQDIVENIKKYAEAHSLKFHVSDYP